MLRGLDDGADVVLPHTRGYPQPLAAAYGAALAPRAELLVDAGRLRPAFLFEECAVVRLDDAALLVDPVLAAMDPARLGRQPQRAGRVRGVLAGDGRQRPRAVRAATLAEAADAVELVLDRHVLGALNGDRITRDGASCCLFTRLSPTAGGHGWEGSTR